MSRPTNWRDPTPVAACPHLVPAGTSDQVNDLYRLALGREDQLLALSDRFRELGMPEPHDDVDASAEEMGRFIDHLR